MKVSNLSFIVLITPVEKKLFFEAQFSLKCIFQERLRRTYLLKSFLRTLIFSWNSHFFLELPYFLRFIIWVNSSPQQMLLSKMKLHSSSINFKIDKTIITAVDFSMACAPNCISVVALKDCEHELSLILANLFNICFKEFCFADS